MEGCKLSTSDIDSLGLMPITYIAILLVYLYTNKAIVFATRPGSSTSLVPLWNLSVHGRYGK